jgi:signal transduction histidine kinase
VPADPGAGGLDALRRLCAEVTRLGDLRCDLEVRGPERPLPAPVAHAAYRILQEALTNARRHGGARRVSVECAFEEGAVALTVTDDGRGGGEAAVVPGSGLRGMRERAARAGGRLEAGPVPGGAGFRVRAELPLGDPAGGDVP